MKKEKIFRIIVPILFFIAAVLAYIKFINTSNDSLKFKTEYEKENKTYYKVKINAMNPVKYSTYNEIYDVIKSGTGIIFFGYPTDNNSRFAINTLLKVIKDNKIDTTVYYLDIHEDRDFYTIENDEIVYDRDEDGKEIKGTKEYKKLLKLLDNYLDNYILYLDEKEYNTNTKRIHIPSIIFVKDGNILSLEYADVDMTEEDLSIILESDILNMYSSSCDIKEAC